MLGAAIGAGLVTAVLIMVVARVEVLRENRLVGWTMLGIIVAIWLGLILLLAYRKWERHYEISSQRIKHRSGWFIRHVDRIEMIDVDDVSYRQGPIQALLNVGTIRILSSDTSHPSLAMTGIGNVTEVANQIDDARRAERRKRGLHVESI